MRSFPERRSRHPVDCAQCSALGMSSGRAAPNRLTDHPGGPAPGRRDGCGGGPVAGYRGVIGERQLRQRLGSVGGLLDQHRDHHIQRNRARHRHRSLQRDDHGPGVRGDLQPAEHRRWLPDDQLLGDGGGFTFDWTGIITPGQDFYIKVQYQAAAAIGSLPPGQIVETISDTDAIDTDTADKNATLDTSESSSGSGGSSSVLAVRWVVVLVRWVLVHVGWFLVRRFRWVLVGLRRVVVVRWLNIFRWIVGRSNPVVTSRFIGPRKSHGRLDTGTGSNPEAVPTPLGGS